ncbi:MAG: carbohydrate kinase family protein [Candidatus Hydrogenedentes bacterium]|nr:carbohydrate kinase family protein [Candidatus Hydrogenedentota bacterium]
MKIAVLGAVCFDEIFPVEGPKRESFGGILYNAAAFSSVLDDGDWVAPVSNVGEDRYEAVLDQFRPLPHVDIAGLKKCPGKLTHVNLTWRTASWRDEAVWNRMPPFKPDDLKPALDCDAVHINFINGTELELPTLRAFRPSFDGIISLDVHNLISRFDADGKREIVGLRDWKDWSPFVDTWQCNEFELASMFGKEFAARRDYALGAKEVCQAGPLATAITLGNQGAITVYRKENEYFCVDIDVLPPRKAVDTTGCGDSFSAGFLLGMLTYDDPATAIACGTIVAGVNARYSGIGRLPEAEGLLKTPRTHFRVYDGKPTDWPGEPI